jgi:uncharacterized integral membrane protein (TIGR00698 family)
MTPADPGRAPAERALTGLLPGLALCLVVAAVAIAAGAVEARLFGRAWIEPLVLAILLGVAVRLAWTPGPRWRPGIQLCAQLLLEIAVALLGATISAQALAAAGLPLLAGIAGLVAAALGISYAIGRAFGLPQRMALLIASGNAICGNSAIAAVAPVIEAEPDDVAAAIGFTAVLGVAVVLLLPLLAVALDLRPETYGVVAGLTVYAVPQVLAAAAPAGPVAMQVGALVKLARVLMLGPVCVALGLLAPRLERAGPGVPRRRPGAGQLIPWFILAFLALLAARSAGWIGDAVAAQLSPVVTLLTVVAMAGLGLGVDPRALIRAGPKVAATAILSIVAITVLAVGLALLLAGR